MKPVYIPTDKQLIFPKKGEVITITSDDWVLLTRGYYVELVEQADEKVIKEIP